MKVSDGVHPYWNNANQGAGLPWQSQILDATKQGIVVIDLQGNIQFQNARARELIAARTVPIANLIEEVLTCSDYLRGTGLQHSKARSNVIALSPKPKPVLIEFCTDWQGNCEIELTVLPLLGDESQLAGIAIHFEEVANPTNTLKSLVYQATHDELTGLANRRVFTDRLRRLAAETNGHHHAMLFMDLDKFKAVNERRGRNAGDDVLKQVAGVMQAMLRQRDTLARLGGDEFGLILEHCSETKAKQIARKLCHAIKVANFEWRGEPFQLTVSIGIVAMSGQWAEVNAIIAAADSACYHSKAGGGSSVTSFRGKASPTSTETV
jgi:diguanylate cyclase (GGDEF)-like protein